MKVRGYRVFYIDNQSGVKDLIEIIKKTTAIKIAMVVKNGQMILNSSVNLKLIKKYTDRYRKELVFVNPDPAVIDIVSKSGFCIYKDLNKLEMGERLENTPLKSNYEDHIAAGKEDGSNNKIRFWSKGKKSSKMKKSKSTVKGIKDNDLKKDNRNDSISNKNNLLTRRYSTIISIFLLLFILVMTYLYFFYPTAVVEIEPVIQSARKQMRITASTEINQIDWQNNTLPLHETEVEISGTEELETSGKKLIGDKKASGVARFINERDKELRIPAGTIITTDDNIQFKTLKDIAVPKLQVDYLMDLPVGMKAGQAEVGIEALVKGSKANVGIGRIKNIVKKVDKVHVINPEPCSGGEDKSIYYVTEADIEKARGLLEDKLKNRLLTKFYQELGGNFRIIEDKISYQNPVYKYNHKVGEEAQTLKVEGSLTAKGYLLKNNEMDRLVTRIFKDKLSSEFQLMSTGINVESISLEEKGKSMYNVLIDINAPVIPAIDSASLVNKLTGLDLKEAGKVLEETSSIENYRIRNQGARLPVMSFAIKVVVKEPEEMKVFNFNE